MSATSSLQAVRVVGGILPPGLLDRVMAGEVSDTTTLSAASYHLPGRESVQDAVSRSWSYLLGAWSSWTEQQASQPQGMDSTRSGLAREQWLLPLLAELGYGRLPALPHGLTVGETDYPLSHAWQYVPIQLLGPGVELDRRNPGVAGAARAPQAMVQELLNRSEQHLWALLSNGRVLRLLRDSTALAGSAYVEFDLQAIFEGELFAEFRLLWQLCHVSRVEKRQADGPPSDCILETWRGEAVEAGTRALDRLRIGVEKAIAALGTGFLTHPANSALRDLLADGRMDAAEFHRHLLRLAYRLIFLCVAEDRDLLLDPAAEAQARERYERYFSTRRLRRLARLRSGSSAHSDLWQALRLVLRALGRDGEPTLGLPALGGLFDPEPGGSPETDAALGSALLGNDALLTAMRQLGWVELETGRGRRTAVRVQPVDYGNLDAEELGSVYESLLELHPRIDLPERRFRLANLAGNERKTTGSYYTPTSLVDALLDTALDPVLDDAQKNAADTSGAVDALLSLTVCDPACGSGHFLVAAARRIARRVAALRSGEDEPTPTAVRDALRDVVGRCVYGVDLNPLAAELAKVSLWLEAMEPGQPLGFLDARIRVGNSLLGTTPALLADGVPDDAFQPLTGDDRKYASAMRKRNKQERAGQEELLFDQPDINTTALAAARGPLARSADDLTDIRAQATHWQDYLRSPDYTHHTTHADAWCAAFVWPLHPGAPQAPTDSVLRRIASHPDDPALSDTLDTVRRLARQYQFFHWHLEFPEVFRVSDAPTSTPGPQGWDGGFDAVVGNPPWERVKLQEQEFFAARDPAIANAPNAAARKKLIAALATSDSPADRALHADHQAGVRRAEGESQLLRRSGRYPLTGRGDVNTYAVFAELDRTLAGPFGRTGIIVPTGIATDATTAPFFRDLVETASLASLYDFENRAGLFPAVDSRMKFSLLTMTGRGERVPEASFAFFAHSTADLERLGTTFTLTPQEITLLNPNTGTAPVFRSRRDAEITVGIYRRVPVLIREGDPDGNPWGVSFMTMFHMSNDSHLFRTREQLEADGWTLHGNIFHRGEHRMLPLYEAKMLHQYDHRWATYVSRDRTHNPLPSEKNDPKFAALTRYWVAESEVAQRLSGKWDRRWLLGWRDICRSTDERTLIAAVDGDGASPEGGTLLALPASTVSGIPPLLAGFNSLAADFAARQKVGGTHLKYFTMRQLPVLPPSAYDRPAPWQPSKRLDSWVTARVLELTYTAWDMQPFALDLGDNGPPFRWDPERRSLLRAELDAAYFHLYGITRDDTDYILDTFPIVKRKDEAAYGEYRTKRLILEFYDRMADAIRTGVPYRTSIDPPPGHGPRHG